MDKRGFCAVCDARFDILPETLVGDGPMREMGLVEVASGALSEWPPTEQFRSVSLGPGQREVSWSPSRSGARLTVLFTCVWCLFLVFWYAASVRGPLIMKLFPLLHVGVGLGLIGWCAT